MRALAWRRRDAVRPWQGRGPRRKFYGTANCFPSITAPISGHFVIQAKHIAAPNKSCSDKDFATLLKKEHKQISRLVAECVCDNYVVFTNRKYTGGADEKYMKDILGLGVKSVHIVGLERLHLALEDFQDIRNTLPNRFDASPFRFDPDDIVEVIGALSEFTKYDVDTAFQSAFDFEKLKMQEKNALNSVTDAYYEHVIVDQSMPHFERVSQFLQNPRNADITDLYHDAADELKQKIVAKRDEFESFDAVFLFMYEQIQAKKEALKGRRRLITILLHYMYFNCDIGIKRKAQMTVTDVEA